MRSGRKLTGAAAPPGSSRWRPRSAGAPLERSVSCNSGKERSGTQSDDLRQFRAILGRPVRNRMGIETAHTPSIPYLLLSLKISVYYFILT
jgi:hypothetical protein